MIRVDEKVEEIEPDDRVSDALGTRLLQRFHGRVKTCASSDRPWNRCVEDGAGLVRPLQRLGIQSDFRTRASQYERRRTRPRDASHLEDGDLLDRPGTGICLGITSWHIPYPIRIDPYVEPEHDDQEAGEGNGTGEQIATQGVIDRRR